MTMGLDVFFDIWIPRLYPGLKYSDPCLKQRTLTPEGTIEVLTWKQACVRELVRWGYQYKYVRELPAGLKKRIPAQLKEKAYFMNRIYEEKYGHGQQSRTAQKTA
jgi:hypothetical protein